MRTLQTVTVPQSGQVSGAFAIGRAHHVAVMFPALTSCGAHLLGSPDGTSASFMRLHSPPIGSGPHTIFCGPGSMAVAVDMAVLPMSAAKIELSVPQAEVRSLTIISR